MRRTRYPANPKLATLRDLPPLDVNGWYPHTGGPNPVPKRQDHMIDIRRRDGVENTTWSTMVNWRHRLEDDPNRGADILAWRFAH